MTLVVKPEDEDTKGTENVFALADIVEKRIKKIKSQEYNSPLGIAQRNGHTEIVKLLLENGAK